MALKDHTIDSSRIAEEQVEAIIDGRVKYDPKNRAVVLLPATRTLSQDKKILIYLAALRGWPFLVTENTPPVDAAPIEISRATGIGNGSVRPLMRALEDKKVVVAKGGRYSLPPHNFSLVSETLSGKSLALTRSVSLSHKAGGKKQTATASSKSQNKRNAKSAKPSLAVSFKKLLDEKWFKGGKTIGQLKEKLDEMTVFPPLSQLPSYLLGACRKEILDRKKETQAGKTVWVYYQK